MSNRRFVPRQRRRLKISLGGLCPAFTADVSPGGFAAETMQPRKPGTMVHGSITLEGREFDFTGEVSWARAGDPRLSIRGRFGVRFTGIDPEFYELFRATFGPSVPAVELPDGPDDA
ncbi:MAG: PilZ domain-containing protein [Myxococcaceae bacterium]|nr:PilZ domain-containing protein [Myxococcaceae bacterium]